MRVLLRADAGEQRGTGHVMRCLTLSEALLARGHEVALMGSIGEVGWLAEHLRDWDGELIPCERDTLHADAIAAGGFDRVVIDSYWIEPGLIAALHDRIPSLAIVDNEARGIAATLYLDHNLGAEDGTWPEDVRARLLAGSRYALVRDAILAQRSDGPPLSLGDRPRVVAFMGGTDPGEVMTEVAASIAHQAGSVELIAITTSAQVGAVRAATASMAATVLPPTSDLPALLGSADLVVSAAGTSAWDVCAMGKPAVLVAVVANQVESLTRALDHGVALGVDGTQPRAAAATGGLLARLIADDSLRREVVARSRATFDGEGKYRVAEALEGLA